MTMKNAEKVEMPGKPHPILNEHMLQSSKNLLVKNDDRCNSPMTQRLKQTSIMMHVNHDKYPDFKKKKYRKIDKD